MLLVTDTAVKLAECANWVHATHCRKDKSDPTVELRKELWPLKGWIGGTHTQRTIVTDWRRERIHQDHHETVVVIVHCCHKKVSCMRAYFLPPISFDPIEM